MADLSQLSQCKAFIERDGEVYLETPAGNFLMQPGQPEHKIVGLICDLHARGKLVWGYVLESGDAPQLFKARFNDLVILIAENDELDLSIYYKGRHLLSIAKSLSVEGLHRKLVDKFNAPTKFGDFFPEHRAEIEAERAEGVRIALRCLA